jgi:hypothetical protein
MGAFYIQVQLENMPSWPILWIITIGDKEDAGMILKAIPCAILLLVPNIATAEPDLDCRIRLEFSSNDTGAVANYVLTLQIKNTLGRAVRGVSVNYYDSAFRQLGNTALACPGVSGEGIPPSSHGECWTQLQKVDGNLLDKFGTEMWTAIVNTQLVQLESIRKCEVLGFAY